MRSSGLHIGLGTNLQQNRVAPGILDGHGPANGVRAQASGPHAGDHGCAGFLSGQRDGEQAQADRARWRGRGALAVPCVQADMVMVPARRDEQRALPLRRDIEAERATIRGRGLLRATRRAPGGERR